MRKTLGLVSVAALTVGLMSSTVVPRDLAGGLSRMFSVGAASAAPINGTSTNHYAVISPVYLGTNTGPQSSIALFNGAGAANATTTSTFSITVVGQPSGTVYGSTFTVTVAHMASVNYFIPEILSLASAPALSGGDTNYAIYIQNPDSEAGYKHMVYDWTTHLFENFSNCNSVINEQMIPLHNEVIVTEAQTSKLSYPSTLYIHNYYNTPITYTMTVFNAGYRANGVSSPNAGKKTCQIAGITVAANATKTIAVSDIEANSACVLDSDEYYMNVVIANQSGDLPNANLSHRIIIAEYNGGVNFSETCAVNPVTTTTTTPPPSSGYLG